MLAADAITFNIGSEVITLRPSLRAAIRLERTLPLPQRFAALRQGGFTAVSAIVNLSSGSDTFLPVAAGTGAQLSTWFPDAVGACIEFLVQLYGLGEPSDEPADPGAKLVPWDEAFADLYRVGTGMLGWTPDQTLDASPREIIEAAKGRHKFVGDILGSIFGKPEDKPSGPDNAPLDRAGLASLKGMGGTV